MSGAEILLEPGVFPRLLQGLWVTVWIAGVSVGLSVPVGLVVGWLMTMKNPVIRVLTRIYLDFIRIMPQLAAGRNRSVNRAGFAGRSVSAEAP